MIKIRLKEGNRKEIMTCSLVKNWAILVYLCVLVKKMLRKMIHHTQLSLENYICVLLK